MKKNIYLKSIFLLLCTLLAGVLSAHAEDYDYECEKVTNLSEVADGETVLLVDKSRGFALSNSGTYELRGVQIAIGEDNVIRNVTANMKWTIERRSDNSFTFKNIDDYLWGSLTTHSVSVSSSSSGATNEFVLENYGEDGGMLYYVGNNGNAYFCWSLSDNKLISIDENTTDRFTLYKITAKNYVKWKKVNDTNVFLEPNDVVVIVDLNTGRAMSNDKGTKDPDAVAVDLNIDKDRITGDVAEKVQWTFTNNGGNYKFAVGENNLYATSDGLRVGTETSNNEFDFSNNDNGPYMGITLDGTQYFAGVDASMFSNVWKLVKGDDDIAKNTQIAIFKKVEDPQKIAIIEMAEYYNLYKDAIDYADLNASITGADFSEINWASTKPGIATAATVTDEETNRTYGKVTGYLRGSTVITASVPETDYHDKASAKSTVIVDEVQSTEPGSLQNPLTVAQAKELIESENKTITIDGQTVTWAEGVRYYIKGKVSKVNSGMMAMFGDMDFGEMMGDSGSGMNFEDSMDDMDFDMEDMEDSGFDMSSMGFDMSSLGFDMSAMFGTSDKVTYYISDDGTKDGQMKVINGCGTLNSGGSTAMEFNPIPKLSAGDCVVVCGPLVYTEDTSMFSGMMGGNSSDEPKKSGKVDEMNYLAVYDPTLLITQPEPKEIYVNKTLDGKIDAETPLYTIDDVFDRFNEDKFPEGVEIQPATYKSSDEDIAKWDDQTNLITGVNEGKAKITVKVKVVLPKREGDDDSKERSYTMKRKFKLIVKTRDLDPAGYHDGEWKLTTSTDDLEDGTRLVLVGTRVKEDKENNNNKEYTDYMMVENNAMMGGGKNGSKIEFDDSNKETIPSSTVISKGGLEVVLEQAEGGWYLNVGEDENGNKLYLYASVKAEESGSSSGSGSGGSGFNFDGIMEMFNPSSGLKVATMEAATADSCKAIISFTDNIATIKYPKVSDDKNNTIMLSSAFDMESMMEMFGGMGGNNEEEENPDEQTEEENTFDMGSFDMFMASFNTKKPGDEQPTVDEETQETKAPKCFMPRIYRFVPYDTYDIAIGSTEWKTIVSYKDVQVPENVEAYIVTKVTPEETQSVASLKPVKELKGGEPYLLHYTSQQDNYTMTLLTPNAPDELEAPKGNLLKKSDRKTSGTKTGSNVYVLANKSLGVGFYRWVGDELGAGRVYLPVGATVAGAHEYCGFIEDGTTAILSIDDFKENVGPFYDLQGRRVDNPKKGIYIVNGKKIVIK